MATEITRRYTLEEYFELERTSEERYEYFNGEVFCMSGGTLSHDRITGNIFDTLRAQIRRAGCTIFTNNMGIKVPAAP
ncbi:MAG TPA: Uma2 family endonuclease, partial [Pyrinomonadaceae bacterium]|nr:Uma2 family endonuclease [Pyrinomonadaceae bacterium]